MLLKKRNFFTKQKSCSKQTKNCIIQRMLMICMDIIEVYKMINILPERNQIDFQQYNSRIINCLQWKILNVATCVQKCLNSATCVQKCIRIEIIMKQTMLQTFYSLMMLINMLH